MIIDIMYVFCYAHVISHGRYQKQNTIPFWRVMSETEPLNHDFEGIIPPQFITNELDPAEVDR